MQPVLQVKPTWVLCLGAHADDIEIGCGATLLQWIEQHPQLRVTWVVWSAAGARAAEAADSARSFLAGVRQHEVFVEEFRDAYFPAQWQAIKQRLSIIADQVQPDVVLTHRLEDRHQDHRVIAELTWNAFRNHLLLEYEIPKFEGDLTTPNFYVPVSAKLVARKAELLNQHFASQAVKDWFSDSTFAALMRLRGLECRSPSGYAEAFHARKLVAASRPA